MHHFLCDGINAELFECLCHLLAKMIKFNTELFTDLKIHIVYTRCFVETFTVFLQLFFLANICYLNDIIYDSLDPKIYEYPDNTQNYPLSGDTKMSDNYPALTLIFPSPFSLMYILSPNSGL